MPRQNPESGRWEVSVCRTDGLTEAEIWDICQRYFDLTSEKPAIGRGVGSVRVVLEQNLKVEADGVPYKQHANIIGWRDEPGMMPAERKSFWKSQAQVLAREFLFRRRPVSQ